MSAPIPIKLAHTPKPIPSSSELSWLSHQIKTTGREPTDLERAYLELQATRDELDRLKVRDELIAWEAAGAWLREYDHAGFNRCLAVAEAMIAARERHFETEDEFKARMAKITGTASTMQPPKDVN